MKTSEHFDLPLSVGDRPSTLDKVYESTGIGYCAEFILPEQAQIAARCINNADKLAHALAVMLVEHSKHQLPSKESIQAALVLEYYRSAE